MQSTKCHDCPECLMVLCTLLHLVFIHTPESPAVQLLLFQFPLCLHAPGETYEAVLVIQWHLLTRKSVHLVIQRMDIILVSIQAGHGRDRMQGYRENDETPVTGAVNGSQWQGSPVTQETPKNVSSSIPREVATICVHHPSLSLFMDPSRP